MGLQALGLQQWLDGSGITAGEPKLPGPLRLGPVVKRRNNRGRQPPHNAAADGFIGLAGPHGPRCIQVLELGEPCCALMQGLQLQAPASHQPAAQKAARRIHQREAQGRARIRHQNGLFLLLPSTLSRQSPVHAQGRGKVSQGHIRGVQPLLLPRP